MREEDVDGDRDRSWDWLIAPTEERGAYIHMDRMLPEFLPEAEIPCCMGAAAMGQCTCWVEVYDVDQAVLCPDGSIVTGPVGGCVDCAYRAGSPEKTGADHVAGDAYQLEAIVRIGAPFACHQGLRRVVGWRHPTLGFVENPHVEASFAPKFAPGPQGRKWPVKADGTPADMCWGWAERRFQYLVKGDG